MKTSYTKENLYDQIERMKRADMPKAACDPLAYGNSLNLSAEELPNLSGKAYGLVMEMLFAAYQLGQIRSQVLFNQEQERRAKAEA
jgi:hypothetical protein